MYAKATIEFAKATNEFAKATIAIAFVVEVDADRLAQMLPQRAE
ncbi:hypothetical protein [Nostoc sp. ChiSLP03a]|nr:hypothetical protein [Nostoc sp. ChiSLP03a]